jgi:glycine dehydrogenase subunit 2
VRAAKEDGTTYKEAPYNMPVRRLDDVKAARELNLAYRSG